MILPVILCGGEGRRLAPLSTPGKPKQFHALAGGEFSLFQRTVLRVRDDRLFLPPVCFGSKRHESCIQQQLAGIQCEPGAVFLETIVRNTAAPVILSVLHAASQGHDFALILPSDHYIGDEHTFKEDIKSAMADLAAISYFGIVPESPYTGYGYIYQDREGALHFHEKPGVSAAQRLIAKGALWNSGIFLLYVPEFLKELARVAPDYLDILSREGLNGYAHIESQSFDTVFCEKTNMGCLNRVRFDWCDLGGWDRLRAFKGAA